MTISKDEDLLQAALEALESQEMADADPEASRRKGYYDRARELRRAVLASSGSDLIPSWNRRSCG